MRCKLRLNNIRKCFSLGEKLSEKGRTPWKGLTECTIILTVNEMIKDQKETCVQ